MKRVETLGAFCALCVSTHSMLIWQADGCVEEEPPIHRSRRAVKDLDVLRASRSLQMVREAN
jgi:hypothetical protein